MIQTPSSHTANISSPAVSSISMPMPIATSAARVESQARPAARSRTYSAR